MVVGYQMVGQILVEETFERGLVAVFVVLRRQGDGEVWIGCVLEEDLDSRQAVENVAGVGAASDQEFRGCQRRNGARNVELVAEKEAHGDEFGRVSRDSG